MKLIEIKTKINWGFWFLGKPLFVIKQYYGMIADSIKTDPNDKIPAGFNIRTMNSHYAQLCDGINGYKIANLYESDKMNGFRGTVLTDVEENIVGFVCGSKSLSYTWKYSALKTDPFYIKYVYVDPKYRGKHYSRIMINQIYENINESCYCLMVRQKTMEQ